MEVSVGLEGGAITVTVGRKGKVGRGSALFAVGGSSALMGTTESTEGSGDALVGTTGSTDMEVAEELHATRTTAE